MRLCKPLHVCIESVVLFDQKLMQPLVEEVYSSPQLQLISFWWAYKTAKSYCLWLGRWLSGISVFKTESLKLVEKQWNYASIYSEAHWRLLGRNGTMHQALECCDVDIIPSFQYYVWFNCDLLGEKLRKIISFSSHYSYLNAVDQIS
jgi:hypothetical protein